MFYKEQWYNFNEELEKRKTKNQLDENTFIYLDDIWL